MNMRSYPSLAIQATRALDLPPEAGRARAFAEGWLCVDPRLPELGLRAILPRATFENALEETGFHPTELGAYDRLRIGLGVPDGSRDMEVDKAILLECGFDELNGVDWGKGCFMGQELTARTKYRALIKKRLLPVQIEGPVPESGATVFSGDKEIGTLRSTTDDLGLALPTCRSLARR